MQKFIEANVEQFIEDIAALGKTKTKVYFSTMKNSRVKVGRYDLFLTNGEKFSFSGWEQFIQSVYQTTYQGKEVNLQKTWEAFKQRNPEDVGRVLIVEYLDSEEHKDKVFNIERVYEKAKDKKISAKEWKEWLKEYAKLIDLEIDEYKSVKKLIEDVEEAAGVSKESSVQE